MAAPAAPLPALGRAGGDDGARRGGGEKQQRLGGPPPPPGVQGLYATLHTAWQHLLGGPPGARGGERLRRAADAADGAARAVGLALVIHLPRKPRQQAEHWVNSMSTQQAQAARGIVVPGALDADAPPAKVQRVGEGAGGKSGPPPPRRGRRRSRHTPAPPPCRAPQ